MKLLHVDASPKGEKSNSRALSRYFRSLLTDRVPALDVDYLDLNRHTPPHPSAAFAAAIYTAPEARSAEMQAVVAESDALCQRLLQADALLFAMPMHNSTVPSVFKAFIDNIVRTGITYTVTDGGDYVGQLTRQKTLFITSRGADLRPGSPLASLDALTPVLRAAFGFIGVADPQFVNAQPLQFADQQARNAALQRARSELLAVAENWAKAFRVAN